MAHPVSLVEIYPPVLRTFSRNRRSIHRICDAVEVLGKSKPEKATLANLLRVYQAQSENATDAPTQAELALLCNHLVWLQHSLFPDGDFERPLNVGKDQILICENELSEQSDELLFDLSTLESVVWRTGSPKGTYRRDIFDAIDDQSFLRPVLDQISTTWTRKDILVTPYSLDEHLINRSRFIAFMHKQFMQNVLTHALANAIHNENYQSRFQEFLKLGFGDFLFGSVAFLEVSFFDLKNKSRRNIVDRVNAYSRLILESDPQYLDRAKNRSGSIVAFSYCDTGPGVERHVREFSPQASVLPKSLGIKAIIDEKIAGRTKLKAGLGLNDIRGLSSGVRAKFLIETQQSTYLHDGYMNLDVISEKSELSRGTSATIFLEM